MPNSTKTDTNTEEEIDTDSEIDTEAHTHTHANADTNIDTYTAIKIAAVRDKLLLAPMTPENTRERQSSTSEGQMKP